MTDVENIQPIHVKRTSVTMEYFLEVSNLDSATAELLKKYDRDGDGSFSKDEVVAIILDLREAYHYNEMLGASNKMVKRMLIAALCFCVLLLTSMFGLIYAVAALTAKISVDGNGVMTTVDGSAIVKTDSTAFNYRAAKGENDVHCLTASQREAILNQLMSGSNVLLERDAVNGTQKQVDMLSSSTIQFQEDGSVCFTSSNGSYICIVPDEAACGAERRRKLTVSAACKANPFDCTDAELSELAANGRVT